MKRSEINAIILDAERFLAEHRFHLPQWASWGPRDWQKRRADCQEIFNAHMGWDITDFGSGNFARRGLFLFTIRNGIVGGSKPYAEKIMIVREEQETPMHFHWHKMEDIINRGGGNLCIELHNATAGDALGATPVRAFIDGMVTEMEAGSTVTLIPGQSICLPPRLYHRFYGQKGAGTVLVGEVSMVNDDANDNRFLENIGRFPAIDEDEEPLHLLVGDYERMLE